MRLIRPSSPAQLDAGLAVLRVVAGMVFAAHGGQKVFVAGLGNVAEGFAGIGIPLAGIVGPAVGLLEFFGGLALIIGLLTRLTASGLAVVMLGAISLVHLSNGFFLPSGYEFTLLLLAAAATLALTGGGRWSMDGVIAGRAAGDGRPRASNR